MLNWFKKPPAEVEIEEPPYIEQDFAKIIFTTHYNGEYDIECDWSDSTKRLAQEYGILLNDICTGKFAANIVEILQEYIEDNPESSEFLLQTLEAWKIYNQLVTDNQQSVFEDAVVQPLKTFGASRFFREQ